jgi:hypothetical protein
LSRQAQPVRGFALDHFRYFMLASAIAPPTYRRRDNHRGRSIVPTLQQLVPEADTLLNLDPEELGILLLRVTSDRLTNGMMHPGNFETELFPSSDIAPTAYPRERRNEVLEAVREAFAWLDGQALLIAADPTNARHGWKRIGRRARRLVSQAGSDEYKAASLLPRNVLHPRIKDNIYFNFQRGDYQTAVFLAFKEVEIAVREASNISGKVGADLMRAAFDAKSGP